MIDAAVSHFIRCLQVLIHKTLKDFSHLYSRFADLIRSKPLIGTKLEISEKLVVFLC